ncbi:hypothetical protein BFL28_06685 [Sphingomonas turrisvirgatae]|jgi:hypothetical protein|uniref:Uncharacterized protein n=1 Tax=Sphingomonas turrisvirgatae TaxID=1888892 RepID=A0A1E3LRL9_9SPHN|nr:hypothetical protein [Sphingomonas turrisvirgatae]ODP36398.1 hypothetical protein BFL28_06685 [Sphingomonas turrisvirgatae]
MPTSYFSPLRARLASFEHAYAVATRLRLATGKDQFVLRTGDPIQPVRVSDTSPMTSDELIARVL